MLLGYKLVPNGFGIVLAGDTYDNTIGGSLPGEGNVIAGSRSGIELEYFALFLGAPTDNLIHGNLIGTDKTGSVGLGGWGLSIEGANTNTIGGITPGAGNVIAFNTGNGVDVDSGTGNSILGNSIFSNASPGILLNSANNANDNQAAPVLTGGSTSSGGTSVSGTLASVAHTTFRIEFFANAAMDPSGYAGPGPDLPRFANVTTDASGNGSFTATFSTVVPTGYFISATATNLATGDTSEFSKDLVVGSFLVTNTNDSGPGSLREAIYDANTLGYGTAANPDLIAFDIPTTDPGYNSTTGAFIIQPLSALPTITDTLVLDGYTQPGASPNTLTIGDNAVLNIVLNGSQAGAVDGLTVAGGNSTVSGLVIDNFAGAPVGGLVLSGGGDDVVTGNFIGTDVTGELAAPNTNGIYAYSPGNTIGGTSPYDRNIISGNNPTPFIRPGTAGIGLGSAGNLIQGNYIGTDKSGTVALGNYIGISAGSDETIGGTSAGAGNVISGNADYGITLGYQNLVAGDLIGTTVTGLGALGNGGGIDVFGNYNTIGGTTGRVQKHYFFVQLRSAEGVGIGFDGSVLAGGSSYNLVEGNYIGTDITGAMFPDQQDTDGIRIFGGYNTIDGTTAAARNIISGNGGVGIQFVGGPGTGASPSILRLATSSRAITSAPIRVARLRSPTSTGTLRCRERPLIRPSAALSFGGRQPYRHRDSAE